MDSQESHMNSDDSRAGESRSRPGLGLITLEDLEAFTDDDFQSDMTLNTEPNGDGHEVIEGEEERLLNFWQDLVRGHQIDVPQEMAQSIQQITTEVQGTSNRERLPFTLVMRKENFGKVLYEKRVYEKACWACVRMQEDTYEQSICAGFMKLMKYICKQNTTGNYLGMTVPIVTVVQTDDTHTTLSRDVIVAYYLPSQHQPSSPIPFDPDITVETWPTTVLYSRTFSGPTNETTILEEVQAFVQEFDSFNLSLNHSFIIAGYTSLAATHRHNEIWFLERH